MCVLVSPPVQPVSVEEDPSGAVSEVSVADEEVGVDEISIDVEVK